MGLKFLSLLLSFYVGAGTLDFVFRYPFAETSPLLFYPETAQGGFYINGRWVPYPLFHINPLFFPSPYRRDVQGNYWNLTRERKEVLIGSRGDLAIRWMGDRNGILFRTLSLEGGRKIRIMGFRENKRLIFWDVGRRKGDFTGRWEDWFTLSVSGEKWGGFLQWFRAEGTGGFFGVKWVLWGEKEGSLIGQWEWEAGGRGEVFYGREDGRVREFYLGDEPFLKIETGNSHYFPWSLQVRLGVRRRGDFDVFLGTRGGILEGKPWVFPEVNFSLRKSISAFFSFSGVVPPVEYLRGLARGGGETFLYTWDGEDWSRDGNIEPPVWNGIPRPFPRLKIGLLAGNPRGLFAGAYFVMDWRLAEDKGICDKQTSLTATFNGQEYTVWNCQGLNSLEYSNFSSLWRQMATAYAGALLKWGNFKFLLRASYFYTKGTYPFLPLSLKPGEFFLYSSSFLKDGNWSPEKNSALEGELPSINGLSGFLGVRGRVGNVEVSVFSLIFRNFSTSRFLLISGLSQGKEYVSVGALAGEWNVVGGFRLTKEFSWGGVIFQGEGFSLREHLWKAEINGEDTWLIRLPRWRLFLGFFLR